MIKTFMTPAEGLSDSRAIQNAVNAAAETDLRTVVIPNTKIWHLDQTVLLPSFVTVILDGAEIHTAGTAFANANAFEKMSLGTENESIFLLGTKGAAIRGESGYQIHLQNVKDFGVCGIRFVEGAGLKLCNCRYGKAEKLEFSHSLHGILLTEGCNNNILEDIVAKTEEEAVLFLGKDGGVWGRSAEIYDTSLSRLEAETAGAPAVAVRTAVRAANLFFHHITDRTRKEGVSVQLFGEGECELADLTVRGVDSVGRPVFVGKNCDGVFLGNLEGAAAVVEPEATRVLVAEERESIALPDLSEVTVGAFLWACDPLFAGESDGQTLQNALDGAAGKCLLIPRYNPRSGTNIWKIDRALRVPSDTTVILLDAHLRLEDFTYCNLFTNAEPAAKNIRIMGVGSATLDSGAFNGLKEKNANTLGFGPIHHNALLLFAGVQGLRVERLRMIQNRWYCVLCIGCEKGFLSGLDLCAHPNFPDMGGIRLHSGCRDITVENITGITGEDTVVLCARDEDDGIFVSDCKDVSDIHIRTVKVNAGRASIVLIKALDGRRIHHVQVENLLDASLPEQKKLPFGCVQVGVAESKNISDLILRDMTGRGESTVQFGGESARVTVGNLHSFGSSASAIRSLPLPEVIEYKLAGASVELAEQGRGFRGKVSDLAVNGIFFRCLQGSRYMRGTATSIITDQKKFIGCVMDLRNLQGENILIENVLAERIGQGFYASGKLRAEIRNFRAAQIGRELAVCGKDCSLTVNGTQIPVTPEKAI